ncbi:Multidrug efflux pump subunit AcrB [Onishia taeanensis]|uniref:Multidrug efflux pump subunit AcrB n=1 Tax=Onishia taeanensis TaxID=284577 RepID=A0A1G7MUD8_9GAMM|nr:efflux RND transporter permease subunit [Halomonas taeanensis]SDF65383.1 Multidrug efflux pump subunit AcrB [Halomonas taeanensis]
MSHAPAQRGFRGPIAWMRDHGVAANLLMLCLILGGLWSSTLITKEVFPSFTLENVNVSVSYPGATPEEIEQSLLLAMESAVQDVEGTDEITATAQEGSGSLSIELQDGIETMRAYQDIQQAIDGLTTLPDAADPPRYSLSGRSRAVIELMLHGDSDDLTLRDVGERLRSELLSGSDITKVELSGIRDRQVQVTLDQTALSRYGLDHGDLAARIGNEALNLAGGSLDTRDGEYMVRYEARRDGAADFARLPVLSTQDGSVIRLGDIATIKDGFADSDSEVLYDGQPAIGLDIYQVGDQTPTELSAATRELLPALRSSLPEGLSLSVADDDSEVYQDRLELLLKNAWLGLVLVLVLLGLFLEARLAFWVTLGIPTAFLGSLLFLPLMDVSINMISMFAFIIALGIVVDDAIIVGENIHAHRERGASPREAAILGAREIAVPLAFAILSNIVAFLPLLFLPGFLGLIFGIIPLVVICIFALSWIEAVFILPAHLSHARGKPNRLLAPLDRLRRRVQGGLDRFTQGPFRSLLERSLDYRGLTVALALAMLVLALGWLGSGRLGFTLMPRVESHQAGVTANLPAGSPISDDRALRDQLLGALNRLEQRDDGPVLAASSATIDADSLRVVAFLDTGVDDNWSTGQLSRAWREEVGHPAGADTLLFESDVGGPGRGAGLTIRLSAADSASLEEAAKRVAERLADYQPLSDIDSGIENGKRELRLSLTATGRALGLDGSDLASQLRGPLQGATALKQQQGRNEVEVKVLLPERDRTSLAQLEGLSVLTPDGVEVPLSRVARVITDTAASTITRIDGRRVIDVTANATPPTAVSQVITSLEEEVFPQLRADMPGLRIGFGGRQQETSDNLKSLQTSLLFTLAALYLLLAIPFRSYLQPLLVMAAIPFGLIGAVIGHLLMGYGLSVISLLGMLALSGIVINDALVLIDTANRHRRAGQDPRSAVTAAALRRLRPILLTTLTTFFGLAPMIFETSRQARFMIPMAVSIGFGILFATLILLLLIPSLYLLIEDARRALGMSRRADAEAENSDEPTPQSPDGETRYLESP